MHPSPRSLTRENGWDILLASVREMFNPDPRVEQDRSADSEVTLDEREPVPVLRPLLPSRERLWPYLQRIDESRVYSNWGPLTSELEQRLSQHFSLQQPGVVSASSGTVALAGALLAVAGRATRRRPLALIPAFTFAATAVAVELCGYRPYVLDVSVDSWQLNPQSLLKHPRLPDAGVVIPVAPFGRAVSQEPWLNFRRTTGIPIVIDAAASFEQLSDQPSRSIGEIPLSLSFHATKPFATGEGGCVVCVDSHVVERVGQALNFGFAGSRLSASPSLNGKMSEYHAAVGLAELDGWADKRQALSRTTDRYRAAFQRFGLADRFWSAPDLAAYYTLFHCRSRRELDDVAKSLADRRVDYRLWYGTGLQDHPQFSDAPHDAIEVSRCLGNRLLGVPMAQDLSEQTMLHVVSAVAAAMDASQTVPGHSV